jgi:ABC-type transport system substrate-binding protein
LAVPTTPGYNPAVVGYPYNPQKASQLLSDAGYPKGFQTSILYPSDYPTPDTWVAAQSYLGNVGISAKLDAADPSRFFQVTASGWHNELAYFGCPVGIGRDPANYLTLRLSSTSPSYDPKSVYIPDDYTTLLNQAATERDPDQRQLKFQQLQKMIIDQYCMVTPFYLFVAVLGKNSTVHDLDLGVYAKNEWLPENAWLSK